MSLHTNKTGIDTIIVDHDIIDTAFINNELFYKREFVINLPKLNSPFSLESILENEKLRGVNKIRIINSHVQPRIMTGDISKYDITFENTSGAEIQSTGTDAAAFIVTSPLRLINNGYIRGAGGRGGKGGDGRDGAIGKSGADTKPVTTTKYGPWFSWPVINFTADRTYHMDKGWLHLPGAHKWEFHMDSVGGGHIAVRGPCGKSTGNIKPAGKTNHSVCNGGLTIWPGEYASGHLQKVHVSMHAGRWRSSSSTTVPGTKGGKGGDGGIGGAGGKGGLGQSYSQDAQQGSKGEIGSKGSPGKPSKPSGGNSGSTGANGGVGLNGGSGGTWGEDGQPGQVGTPGGKAGSSISGKALLSSDSSTGLVNGSII